MTTMTQSEFATHIGQQKSYITQLKQAGRLVMDGDKVMVEESLNLINETKDPGKEAVAERHQANREQKPVDAQNDEVIIKNGSEYQQARAMREKYNAMQARIAYEQAIGQLLEINDVRLVVANGDAIVRNRLESLPDVLAPILTAEIDEQRVRSILIDYIEQTLSELSRSFNQLAGAEVKTYD